VFNDVLTLRLEDRMNERTNEERLQEIALLFCVWGVPDLYLGRILAEVSRVFLQSVRANFGILGCLGLSRGALFGTLNSSSVNHPITGHYVHNYVLRAADIVVK
jgi:hypothetical protein